MDGLRQLPRCNRPTSGSAQPTGWHFVAPTSIPSSTRTYLTAPFPIFKTRPVGGGCRHPCTRYHGRPAPVLSHEWFCHWCVATVCSQPCPRLNPWPGTAQSPVHRSANSHLHLSNAPPQALSSSAMGTFPSHTLSAGTRGPFAPRSSRSPLLATPHLISPYQIRTSTL